MECIPTVQRLLASLSLGLICFNNAAAWEPPRIVHYGPYAGTLGKREVVAQFDLDAQGSPVQASFFYRDTGKDIVLYYDATHDEYLACVPTWREDETTDGCAEPGAYWKVMLSPGLAVVDWRAGAADAPQRTVLTKVQAAAGADPDAQLDALRLAGPRLAGPVQGKGAVRWRMLTEPRSRVSMPFLVRSPSPAATRAINAELEKRFQGQILMALFNTARPDGEADFSNKVFITGTRYLAVAESTNAYSGGAHGSFDFSVDVFDLRSGRAVDLRSRYHIVSFAQKGRNTAGLSLSEQALAQRQVSSYADSKESYWRDGIACWETAADEGLSNPSMRWIFMEPSSWTVFPVAEGLAIAYGNFAESMRGCRGDYRVIPWRQAALARRRGNPKTPAE